MTQEGAILGTPAYMAPEQAAGREFDGRAEHGCAGFLKKPIEEDQLLAELKRCLASWPE